MSFHSTARQTSWASAAPVVPANKPGIVLPAAAEQDANDLRVHGHFSPRYSEIFIGDFRAIATVDSVQRNSHVLKTLQRQAAQKPSSQAGPDWAGFSYLGDSNIF